MQVVLRGWKFGRKGVVGCSPRGPVLRGPWVVVRSGPEPGAGRYRRQLTFQWMSGLAAWWWSGALAKRRRLNLGRGIRPRNLKPRFGLCVRTTAAAAKPDLLAHLAFDAIAAAIQRKKVDCNSSSGAACVEQELTVEEKQTNSSLST
jgi:hypothetical protein